MSKIDILIVEDETIVALDIKRSILKMGFSVTDMVTNYTKALISIEEKKPNIILLDINLRKSKSGIELAKEIQRVSDGIPFIYLTAFSDDRTIQKAVKTNPIGYLVKPFKVEDLKSVLQLSIYKILTQEEIEDKLTPLGEGFLYDESNHNLFFKKHPIKLSQKEKILLEILIEAKGDIVPFAVLETHIWESQSISDSALRTLLYRLRSKLEYKLIETVPSFGIKLVSLCNL